MPPRFPGMNPYLEQSDTWEDFHHEFLTRARAMLAAQLDSDYVVKVAVRPYIHELSAEDRRFFGRAVESVPDSWLEVRDRRGRRVITAIELLSPGNKDRAAHREAHLAKRNVIFASPTHFVEIDLRRGGERPNLPELPECDYYALVSRSEHRPDMGFWPISLRERLPVILIPLSGDHPDVALDMQMALDQAYDAAHYGNYIYSEEPEPPLSPDDAHWAVQFVPTG